MNSKLKYFLRDYVTYRALIHSEFKYYGYTAKTVVNIIDDESMILLRKMHLFSKMNLLSIMRDGSKKQIVRSYSKLLMGIGLYEQDR